MRKTGVKARLFDKVGYRTGSWKRFRRVVMKAEAMAQGTNRRFVVNNLEGPPEALYDFYVQRGDAENRIKDLKNALFADRLSCSSLTANPFRLVLHAAAYVLRHALRRHLAGSEPSSAPIRHPAPEAAESGGQGDPKRAAGLGTSGLQLSPPQSLGIALPASCRTRAKLTKPVGTED